MGRVPYCFVTTQRAHRRSGHKLLLLSRTEHGERDRVTESEAEGEREREREREVEREGGIWSNWQAKVNVCSLTIRTPAAVAHTHAHQDCL